VVFAAPTSTKSLKPTAPVKLDMIAPANDSKTKTVKDVPWELYPKKKPHWGDVKQSGVLMGCALASVLGALSNTLTGDRHLMQMIKEVPKGKGQLPVSVEVNLTNVLSDLSDDAQSNFKRSKKVTSNRYFIVKIAKKSYKVSSVLYTFDTSNLLLVYMTSPNDALWPCIIEKAYAKHLNTGGYAVFENFADPEVVWKDIIGKKPKRLHLATAKAKDIYQVVKDASRIPTIATTSLHGYTVLGLSTGKKIGLRDPWTEVLSKEDLEAFRAVFTDLFYGAP
jgi:hypothetical protein